MTDMNPLPQPTNLPPPPNARRGNGKLTAAGILQLIQGAFVGLVGLWLFSASQSGIGEIADDLTGGTLTFVAVLLIGISIALIWVAVMCIRGRKGGWVTTVVFQSIFLASSVLGLIGSPSEGDSAGGLVVIAYCGVALGLSISGGRELSKRFQ